LVREQLHSLLAQQTAKQRSPLQQSLPPPIKRRGFVGYLVIGLVGLTTAAGSAAVTGSVLQYLASRTRLPSPDTTAPSPIVTPTSGTPNSPSLTVPLYT